MKPVTLVLGDITGPLFGPVIGVDYGAYLCASLEIQMMQAVGDFDSVNAKQMAIIKDYAKEIIILDPIKDVTDFAYALSLCDDYDQIFVYGALGRRLDHEMINLFKAFQDPRIILLDDKNKIQSYLVGEYTFINEDYKYFSIIPFENARISLKNFKYPLSNRSIKLYDDYLTSNEVLEQGSLEVHEGRILVIQSND